MATFSARLRGVLCGAGLGLSGIVLLLLVAMLLRAYGTRPSGPAVGLREKEQQGRQRQVEAAFSPRELQELKEVLQGKKISKECKSSHFFKMNVSRFVFNRKLVLVARESKIIALCASVRLNLCFPVTGLNGLYDM